MLYNYEYIVHLNLLSIAIFITLEFISSHSIFVHGIKMILVLRMLILLQLAASHACRYVGCSLFVMYLPVHKQ